MTDIAIADIEIGERHRKDMGDIDSLAESIRQDGLLHPVVVTTDHRLIAGERRIRACLQLGMKTIPVRVIDIPSIVRGEYAENAVRKDFVPSEQVAIAKEIEALELGGRRGGDHGNQHTGGKRDNCPPCQKGKTRDLAAKRVGFPTGKTYERAKKAVEKAIPEVVKAMDAGEISINRAYQLSHLPEGAQRDSLESSKAVTAKRPSPRRSTPPSKSIGKKARDVLAASGIAMRLRRNCNALRETLEELEPLSECPSNASGDLALMVAQINSFMDRKGLRK